MTELSQEQIELVRQYLTKQQSHGRAAVEVKAQDERRFFYIERQGFATLVSDRDASDENTAYSFALEEPLQAWYYVPVIQRHGGYPNDKPTIEVWTHDQYCDWLRSKSQLR